MKKACIGDCFQIHCYKHNKKIHRAWDEAVLLHEAKDYLVFGNNKTLVIEAAGNSWRTKEPAVMYFFKDKWFNVIAQIKKDGVYYYCNIATPYIIEEHTIKYIDYDLDLRIFPNKDYKILDKMEYNYHKKIMHYSDELDVVVNGALKQLIEFYQKDYFPFRDEQNLKYYEQYAYLKNEEKM